jgi:diguanylate cyclase (GGDEF)-like protein
LPPAVGRFWHWLKFALLTYLLGMAVDLGALLVTAAIGRTVPMYGAQLIYPVAGLVTLYAVFQYPTTERSRPERLRVGLDVGIVLLGAASFIWYFNLGHRWSPDHGWLALSQTLALPVMVLVAGFGVLRVAFVGVKVFARSTLSWYAACIVLSGVATALPDDAAGVDTGPAALLLLAQLCSLTGALTQYRATVSAATAPPRRAGRQFSVLPYAASGAAFTLLFVVVEPGLDWRRYGVLVGVGALLCLVTLRQSAALRENGRLLTQNRILTEQLQHQAWHDELTGLANRAYFSRRVEDAIQLYTTTGCDTALLLIDLDGFKAVNDTLGHAAGDELLCEIAGRLVSEAHDATVCRLGGDEFVVLVEQPAEEVARLADRLVRAVAAPVSVCGHATTVSASIGITFVSAGPTRAADLLRRADSAMYAVKSSGKNNWQLTPAPATV